VEGIIDSAQDFGGLLAFLLPGFVALWRIETGLRRPLALVGIGMALLCVLLSASRGAMLGVVVGAVMAAVYLRRDISAQFLVRGVIAVLILSGFAFLVVLSTDFRYLIEERLTTGISTGDVETMSSGRTAIWFAALREMANRPISFITGLGWEAYFQTIGHRYATHNVYLDRLYNLGTIGLALFVASFAGAITTARRGLRSAPEQAAPFLIATVIGMTSFMIAMTFSDIHAAATYVWAYTGLALRMAVSTAEVQRDDRRQSSNDHANPATRPMSSTPRR
jgi:O-antigen ligase